MTDRDAPRPAGSGADTPRSAGSGPDTSQTPGSGPPDAQPPRSGLRNPFAAVRGVGAGALVVEAIVLLLAIVPLIKLGAHVTGAAVAVVVTLAVLCLLLAGLLRYRWAWYVGLVPQVALLASGYFHVALAVLGVLFGLLWLYVLNVRRSVLGSSRPG